LNTKGDPREEQQRVPNEKLKSALGGELRTFTTKRGKEREIDMKKKERFVSFTGRKTKPKRKH